MSLIPLNQPFYAILGNGAFGTALAAICAQNHPTILLGRNLELSNHIDKKKENFRYLKGKMLPLNLRASSEINLYLPHAKRILIVVPAQKIREILKEYQNFIPYDATLIVCSKGIEQETGALMHEIAEEIFPQNTVAMLSGPSFAVEMVQNLPTAVAIASKNIKTASLLCQEISTPNFRCYANQDIKGVALGGALKNIFAIASGICAGKDLGSSANAALITRCFSELRRIATSLGAQTETICGLSGFGDLLLTCSGPKSRNFSYGLAFAKGKTNPEYLVEGIASTKIASKICQIYDIDIPILTTIYQTIEKKISIDEAIYILCNRPLKIED